MKPCLDIQSSFIPICTFLRWVFLCNKIKFVKTWLKDSKLFICTSGHGICKNLRIIIHKLIIHTKLLKPQAKIFSNKFSEFHLMFMSMSQPSYLCSFSIRYELNINQKWSLWQDEQVCKVKVRIFYFFFSSLYNKE